MPSFIPNSPRGQRLAYELVYAWPFGGGIRLFNPGLVPVEPDIANNPLFAQCSKQIQLYAELFKLASLDAEGWQRSDVLEVAAGGCGGLFYLQQQYRPRTAVGLDFSSVAAWRGRRLGIKARQGDALALPFKDRFFDCVICVDAMAYLSPQSQIRLIREKSRVKKSGGIMLLAETIYQPLAAAQDSFRQLGANAGLSVERFLDVGDAVRRSVAESAAATERFVAKFPRFLRPGLAETLAAESSERYRSFQSGKIGFVMVALK